MPQNLPITKPNMDAIYANQLNEQRNKDLLPQRIAEIQEAETYPADESSQGANPGKKESAGIPFGILFLAIIFDLIGFIPIINFISEPIAGIIFWIWQKQYAPKSNPLTTLIYAKLADLFSFGMLPSNTGVVIYAYIVKKYNLNVGEIATEAVKGAAKGGLAGAGKAVAMEAGKEVMASKRV